MGYDFAQIKAAYEAVGVTRGALVLVKGDIRPLGAYRTAGGENVVQGHVRALLELIDPEQGTLVVCSGSPSLCNTDTVFDPQDTPSEMGVLSEAVRRLPGAVRSRHPFYSYAAVGPLAQAICGDCSRHVYGPETPKARLIEAGALFVSVGLHPRLTSAVVHHLELTMGVPYRYVKEFLHPVRNGREVAREPFYLHVWYRECQVERDFNEKIFAWYEREHTLRQAGAGAGKVHSLDMAQYHACARKGFKDDIYIWLRHEPEKKPYRE